MVARPRVHPLAPPTNPACNPLDMSCARRTVIIGRVYDDSTCMCVAHMNVCRPNIYIYIYIYIYICTRIFVRASRAFDSLASNKELNKSLRKPSKWGSGHSKTHRKQLRMVSKMWDGYLQNAKSHSSILWLTKKVKKVSSGDLILRTV